MTTHDPETPLERTPHFQTPARQILVWRQPKLLWIGMIVVFGLALPGYVFHKMEDPLGFNLALPAACVATFFGVLSIECRKEPLQFHDDVFVIYLKSGGVIIAGLSLVIGPFFPIGIVVGLIYGLPWAIWVSLITAYHAMKWGEPEQPRDFGKGERL